MRLATALALLLTLSACGADSLTGDSAGFRVAPPTDRTEAAYTDGLEAWRKPGATDAGAACANCHAPDALDLAYFDFSDDDIRRRAAFHLEPEAVERIVAFVHAQRTRYRIRPRDPRTHRPLQPGGDVLPGTTPAERDAAFGDMLAARGLRFATEPVLTRAEALAARDELLAVDLRGLPVGVAFNRWSEDPHSGNATIADWLPDLPALPSGSAGALYDAHDRYLADPTDAALVRLLGDTRALTSVPFAGNGARLMEQKYASVLAAQHLFRDEVTRGSAWGRRPASAFFPVAMTRDNGPNPVWEVGSFARDEKHGDVALPAHTLRRISGSMRDEMTAVRIPWFWAGWMFDVGLQRTNGSNATKSAEYLLHHLDDDFQTPGTGRGGMRVHAAFVVTKRILHEHEDPAVPTADPFTTTYSNFSAYDRAWKWAPTDAARRARYVLMTENSFRLMLHLAEAHLEAGDAVNRAQVLRTVDQMEDFFRWAETPHQAASLALAARVRAALQTPT